MMLVAVDESDHSFYALEWTLDHFFPPNENHSFQLIVIHARVSPSLYVGMGGIGKANPFPFCICVSPFCLQGSLKRL